MKIIGPDRIEAVLTKLPNGKVRMTYRERFESKRVQQFGTTPEVLLAKTRDAAYVMLRLARIDGFSPPELVDSDTIEWTADWNTESCILALGDEIRQLVRKKSWREVGIDLSREWEFRRDEP